MNKHIFNIQFITIHTNIKTFKKNHKGRILHKYSDHITHT
jgi:hypothetical protein